MKINKQTLFYVDKYMQQSYIFDLKLMSTLNMRTEDAEKFCKIHNETECLNQLKNGKTVNYKMIYLSTNQEVNSHALLIIGKGEIEVVLSNKLIKYTRDNQVLNLEYTDNNKIKILWMIEQPQKGFKQEIERKLVEFNNSMKLIGNSQNIEYMIVGKYVILISIESDINKVVIPSFIDSIASYALGIYTREITILDGVKFIGNQFDTVIRGLVIKGGKNVKYALTGNYICTLDYFKKATGVRNI